MAASPLHMCPRCGIGRLAVRQKPYTRVHDGLFISVPNVNVYTCDVCGFQEVEEAALIELDTLVGQFSVPPVDNRPASKLPPVETDGLPPTTRPKP
ncbi:MAG: hypothetical protein SF162_06990 [bacterium]|nr:hypothetical protein [bacterium]